MKSALIAGLVTLAWASPAPQLDTIKDMFRDDYYGDAYGDAYEDAYHGDKQTGRLEDESNGVEVIVQVVKNEDGYVAPDDYYDDDDDDYKTPPQLAGSPPNFGQSRFFAFYA